MKNSLALVAAMAALGAAGCAGHKTVPETAPTPEAAVSSPGASDASTAGRSSYVVKKGDSLWTIAGQSGVLGDPFRWPLLFKANRDQIQDPDFIDVSLDLNYKTDYTADEIADAVKKAQITPPFQPRKRPRKVLPIQY
jgi:hypothetical protein